jgi:acetoin utilization deacetylase AcuC-like enzyme
MGFCLFNNVAVGAQWAQSRHGVERVLIVDWDLHHGNGTQHLFEHREDVLFYSSHQYGKGFYPGSGGRHESGRDRGVGATINAPLRPGDGDAAIVAALVERLVPVATAFAPDLVLVSAGFDAHRDDPLGNLQVSDAGFVELALRVAEIADRSACGRVVLALEGGYSLQALASSIGAVASALTRGCAS